MLNTSKACSIPRLVLAHGPASVSVTVFLRLCVVPKAQGRGERTGVSSVLSVVPRRLPFLAAKKGMHVREG